jgi:hypothetical protein
VCSSHASIISGTDTLAIGKGLDFDSNAVIALENSGCSPGGQCSVLPAEANADLRILTGLACLAIGCCPPVILGSLRRFWQSKEPFDSLNLAFPLPYQDTTRFSVFDTTRISSQCQLPQTQNLGKNFIGGSGGMIDPPRTILLMQTHAGHFVLVRIAGLYPGKLLHTGIMRALSEKSHYCLASSNQRPAAFRRNHRHQAAGRISKDRAKFRDASQRPSRPQV